ncbi:MAG: crossover junction endodeoxyribonuclease RuvC [Bryobacterales bacterium]|nr:crossover junction endodeoxyribonuclease RuvC [Bryobacterales bacterium]
MLVLGVDCGTARTGYGVICSDGREHRLRAAGTIVTQAKRPLPERLLAIAGELRRVIRDEAPDAAAVEGVFHAVNARTALSLAHVRGIALLALAEAGLAVGEYSPLEVKMSVAGYGRAEKSQVQRMVHSLLALETGHVGSEDACDALAVAICHATHLSANQRMGGRSR